MSPEEQAVIEAAREWREDKCHYRELRICLAIDALAEMEATLRGRYPNPGSAVTPQLLGEPDASRFSAGADIQEHRWGLPPEQTS